MPSSLGSDTLLSMDRSSSGRNPVSLPGVFSDPRLSPTEQDVYGTAHLFRALARSAGHNTYNKNPIWPIQVPSRDVGELYQTAYISLRHST